MILHPHITKTELDQYCALAHEHRTIRTVKVDPQTLRRIRHITKSDTYQGVKFYAKT